MVKKLTKDRDVNNSNPNDLKHIELLKEVVNQAHGVFSDICASYMSVVDDNLAGYFKAKEKLEDFTDELEKLEEHNKMHQQKLI